MATPVAVQVHCPFCNAAQAVRDRGNYVCDFCLQSFSVQEAEREENRLSNEIEAWLRQRVGTSAIGSAAIDASSRAYIFQSKMLPDIRRDVDRALEILGDHAQHPLVDDPIGARADRENRSNPLLTLRKQILAFKDLRARLSSEHITSFAMTPQDKEAVLHMDRRIADVLHLSNVVEACSLRSPEGYAAARRNLELLATDLQKSLAEDSITDRSRVAFLAATLERFRCLAEVCGIYESVTSPNPTSGSVAADRLTNLSRRLQTAAQQIESSGYSPAETLPSMIGMQKEVSACESLSRWLRAFDSIAGRSSLSFSAFAAEMTALVGNASPGSVSDWVEACSDVIRATRGEIAVMVVENFDWVQPWVERIRAKKTFGMFGAEEALSGLDEFFLPVWVADVGFSRSAGTVFKEGIEGNCLALVDACAASAERVLVLDEGHALRGALADHRPLSGRTAALPRSTRSSGLAAIQAAMRSKPQMLNASVKIRGLAFLPAAVARFISKKGPREVAICLDGLVPMDSGASLQLRSATELRQRLS